ncbi:hypothetical protein BJ508DRAFT_331370 [Ascobolus immersus RN42]|uniref:BTB domain-containing protein n=1 Tax=Ascobolus immersus RN42 TaxID=1160509 RepID=A0A3N4HUJ5_ASCIM|nr:hypothetical protein BJ508DRAFT_331370 [Ascobolus immersus RN42]
MTQKRASCDEEYACPVCKKPKLSRSNLRHHLLSECLEADEKTKTELPPVLPANEFASNGDLILSVAKGNSNESTNFRVDSRVLVASSPVFARMLDYDSQFSEGRMLREWYPGSDPVVLKLDDKPESLRTVFLILFLRNAEVPKEVSLQEFAEFAVVVDKYDLTVAVQLWTEIWKKDLDVKDALICAKCKYLLLISWVFSYDEFFEESTRTIILDFVLKPGLQFEFVDRMDGGKVHNLPDETSQCILERLREKMKESFHQIHAPFEREEETRIEGIGTKCFHFRYPSPYMSLEIAKAAQVCDYMQLGSLHEAMKKRNTRWMQLREEVDGGVLPVSLGNLCAEVLYLKDPVYDVVLPGCNENHNLCSWLRNVHPIIQDLQKVVCLQLSEFPSKAKNDAAQGTVEPSETGNEVG